MSLRSRIACLFIGLSILLMAIKYAVQEYVVMPTFVNLEQAGARRDMDRCVKAIHRDAQSLENMANDWAAWDDTYSYVQDRNPRFEQANLAPESFTNAHLDFLCVLDRERNIVWAKVYSHNAQQQLDVPDLLNDVQRVDNPMSSHQTLDSTATGLLMTSRGPLLAASRPILTTKRQGPIRGAVIMGRFLDRDEIEDLSKRTEVHLEAWSVSERRQLPEEAQRVWEKCSQRPQACIEPVSDTLLHAYRCLNDVYDQPIVLLRIDVPRNVTEQGKVAAHLATLCSVVGAVITFAAMWLVLQQGMVAPLRRMAAHMVHMGKSGNLKSRLNFSRNDEIGTLAREFDEMAEKLAQYREKVLESAHQAGMAEVASEVLHNVGNAMNSANCSLELLREQIAESKAVGLERAAMMLREHAPNIGEFLVTDPRGPKLLEYIAGLSDVIQQEHAQARAAADRLHETLCHIRDVIVAQQSYTGSGAFRQEVALVSLIEEALLLNREQIAARRVEVALDIPELPEVLIDKCQISQVLVNLIRNAVQAMENQDVGPRRLTISVRLDDAGGVTLAVGDTGCGIDASVRPNLFSQGFTTKQAGHGVGLHYCANVIKSMNGSISAKSEGLGRGATFTIFLPEVVPQTACL